MTSLVEGNTCLFAGVVMEFSYLEDYKMAKSVTIPICEAGKLFLMLKWVDIGGKVVNTRTCTDTNGHNV